MQTRHTRHRGGDFIIYDFSDPKQFKALERQAYDGTVDVSRFPPAAYRYFDSLRLLYARYKYDNLSKEDAAAEKQKLLAQYNEATAAVMGMKSAYQYYQDNIRKAGSLLSQIEKSHNIAEIAMLACECIGMMTNDTGFLKRQKSKFE